MNKHLGGNTFEEFEDANGIEYFRVGIDQRSDVCVALSCGVKDLVDVGQGVMLTFLRAILVVSNFQQGAFENSTYRRTNRSRTWWKNAVLPPTVQFTAVWTHG